MVVEDGEATVTAHQRHGTATGTRRRSRTTYPNLHAKRSCPPQFSRVRAKLTITYSTDANNTRQHISLTVPIFRLAFLKSQINPQSCLTRPSGTPAHATTARAQEAGVYPFSDATLPTLFEDVLEFKEGRRRRKKTISRAES